MISYDGKWTVERGADSLAALGGRIPRGIILERKPGLYLLACPACGAMQITANILTGTDDAPTFERPVICGAGRCKQCGVTFRIVGGRCQPCDPQDRQKTKIPEYLRAAGVRN